MPQVKQFASPAFLNGRAKATLDSAQVPGRVADQYLLLVNTAIASMMTDQGIKEFDKSPYDGLAVAFWHAYETGPLVSSADMVKQIAQWKQITRKDIWPWVYVNRMIGPDETQSYPLIHQPYFKRLKGADLDDLGGARTDFLNHWQNSLRAAKASGAPGVVCDLEFYNNYKEYDPAELARQARKSPEEVVGLLRDVGKRMADIAATEFPNATLWFLFTGFTHFGYKTIDGQPYYPSPTYVAIGLLNEIQAKHFDIHVLSGGEGSLGYCHRSLPALQEAIRKRGSDFASSLQTYHGSLELSGTISMWSEPGAKRSWAVEGECGTATAATAEDFEPYLELLFRSYRNNWIWASPDGGYNAFEAASAERFNRVIREAKARVTANPPR